MKSIERRFNNIAEKNPNWSSYYCFYETVKGQGFNKQTVYRWFSKLVSSDDFAENEKADILKYLVCISDKH
jgi:hypothetical protein